MTLQYAQYKENGFTYEKACLTLKLKADNCPSKNQRIANIKGNYENALPKERIAMDVINAFNC